MNQRLRDPKSPLPRMPKVIIADRAQRDVLVRNQLFPPHIFDNSRARADLGYVYTVSFKPT